MFVEVAGLIRPGKVLLHRSFALESEAFVECDRFFIVLLDFFCREHYQAGYTFVLPPHLLLDECGFAAGQ